MPINTDTMKNELVAKQAGTSASAANAPIAKSADLTNAIPKASSQSASVPAVSGSSTTPIPKDTASMTTSVSQSGTVSMPAYADPDRVAAINNMYDANIASQQAALESAYNQNLSNLESNREDISKRYQQARNTAANDYERQRRNFNEQAMSHGLNVGVGSQAALAQNASYQRQQGTINASESADVSKLNQSIVDLKMKYQDDINKAITDNDYKRAAAMLDEYNMAYNRAQESARIQAQYGDFSGYASLYGQETADQMQNVWTYQNPGIAYSLGYIGADTYYQLTGRYPAGYSSGRGGSNSGGNRSGGGNPPPAEEPDLDKLGGTSTNYSWQNDDRYLANLAANGGTRFDAQQNAAATLAASNNRIAAQQAQQAAAQAAAQAQSQTAAGTFTDWDSSYRRPGSGRTNRG